jgi:hypothetical protein
MKPFIETRPFHGAWVARRADERMCRMIKGFHETGDLLAAESKADPRRAQNLVYSMLFAYRQALELQLKNILIEFGAMGGEEPNFRSHRLPGLWARCRRVIEQVDSHLRQQDSETLDVVEGQIAEFAAIDPGSDAFRFAHDTGGKLISLNLREIDLDNLRHVMGCLFEFLECVVYHLRYIEDTASDRLL